MKNELDQDTNEWSLKRILIRLLAYPFCVFIIVLGIYSILEPKTSKSAAAGLGGIIIASVYLYSDIKILITKNDKRKP